MTSRGYVGRVFSTVVLAAALWALSAGVSSAQVCGGFDQPPCPSPIVTCPVPGSCGIDCSPTAPVFCPPTAFAPGDNVKVFTFGRDNSIQVKFPVLTCPVTLTVSLVPTTQADFHARVKSPPSCTGANCCNNPPSPVLDDGVFPPEVTCHETVSIDLGVADDPTTFCAVYHLTPDPGNDPSCYTRTDLPEESVEYLIGWKAPDKGNKHDFFLLRDPDIFDTTHDDGTQCFIQNITVGTVIGNYKPGGVLDPGLGGKTCCPSDYVVARQKIRPVTP